MGKNSAKIESYQQIVSEIIKNCTKPIINFMMCIQKCEWR